MCILGSVLDYRATSLAHMEDEMDDEEAKKYAKTVFAMTTDYLMGGITKDTYIANLESVIRNMKK